VGGTGRLGWGMDHGGMDRGDMHGQLGAGFVEDKWGLLMSSAIFLLMLVSSTLS